MKDKKTYYIYLAFLAYYMYKILLFTKMYNIQQIGKEENQFKNTFCKGYNIGHIYYSPPLERKRT
jgi:hypothetical protein